MKRKHLIAMSAVAVTLSTIFLVQSCTKIGGLLNFNLSMQTETVNVTIPVTTDTSGTITIGPTVTNFNVDSFVKAQTGNQLGAANINSVKLNSVIFSLNNAGLNANNFSAFQSIAASFTSNTNSTPYAITIANNPDVYATVLNVPVDTTVELKSYIGNTFNYTVTGKLRHPTTIPLQCTISVTFSVNVKG
jgi:hypothetical protein